MDSRSLSLSASKEEDPSKMSFDALFGVHEAGYKQGNTKYKYLDQPSIDGSEIELS